MSFTQFSENVSDRFQRQRSEGTVEVALRKTNTDTEELCTYYVT